jgi:ApaG protein
MRGIKREGNPLALVINSCLGWRRMEVFYQELEGLRVHVDDVIYMPSLEYPPDKPHPFVYFITIENASIERVRIMGRKWVIKESGGEITVVEGSGLVGQSPLLEPGGVFSYNSYHVVARDAQVEGSFFGVTSSGENVRVSIPSFQLEIPEWAR